METAIALNAVMIGVSYSRSFLFRILFDHWRSQLLSAATASPSRFEVQGRWLVLVLVLVLLLAEVASFEQIFWRVLTGLNPRLSSFGDNFPGGCLQKDCLASGSQFAREILESPCYAVKMNAKAHASKSPNNHNL